jgi:hypothetical protein
MQSCLTCFHTYSSGFSSGAYPGREEQAQPPIGGRGELLHGVGTVHWMTVQDEKDRALRRQLKNS